MHAYRLLSLVTCLEIKKCQCSSKRHCSTYRPVKIIRLVGGNTVEDLVLRRAQAKLKLTHAVIEGGHLSTELSPEESVTSTEVYKIIVVEFYRGLLQSFHHLKGTKNDSFLGNHIIVF